MFLAGSAITRAWSTTTGRLVQRTVKHPVIVHDWEFFSVKAFEKKKTMILNVEVDYAQNGKQIITSNSWMFNSSQCPNANPIEIVWMYIKHKICRKKTAYAEYS